MSSEFVESVRDRKGGMLSMQFKPNADLDVTLTGFHSQMNANNNGRLTSGAIYSMLMGKGEALGGTTGTSIRTGSGWDRLSSSARRARSTRNRALCIRPHNASKTHSDC